MDPLQEEQVVEKCRQGDLSAYRMIYERYEQPLLRTACRMLGRQQDAEDAVQDAFMKLYRGIHGFRKGARFSSYLFRILFNACTDILRKRKRAVVQEFDDTVHSTHSSHEIRHSIVQAVGMLPTQMRMCFTLFEVEQFTQEEIAEMLGISTGSVKSSVHRARQRLRTWLRTSSAGEKP
ncbi:MAG: RNA polymerase sigma factor [Candidatus Aminicenantes bacterium]|nr:RNA polymerase sigma factor [Candidatus Aminicenantes bacterium]